MSHIPSVVDPLKAATGTIYSTGHLHDEVLSVADSVERKDCSFLSNFICHKVGSSMEVSVLRPDPVLGPSWILATCLRWRWQSLPTRAVVDECGLVSSVVGVDVLDGEVVGGEVLLGDGEFGDEDVVAVLVEEDVTGLQGDCFNPLAT